VKSEISLDTGNVPQLRAIIRLHHTH